MLTVSYGYISMLEWSASRILAMGDQSNDLREKAGMDLLRIRISRSSGDLLIASRMANFAPGVIC